VLHSTNFYLALPVGFTNVIPLHFEKDVDMKCNVGGIDRMLRIIVGLVLIGLAITGTTGAWAWIGVVPLATGIFRFCPAYPVLGINTGDGCSK